MAGGQAAAQSSANRRRQSNQSSSIQRRDDNSRSGINRSSISSSATATEAACVAASASGEKDDVVSPLREGDGRGRSPSLGGGKKAGGPNGAAFENSGETSMSTLHPQDRYSSGDESAGAGAAGGIHARIMGAATEVRARSERFSRKHKPAWLKETLQKIQMYRQLCGRIVNDERVQMLIVLLICVNAIMMGIATFDFVTENPQIDRAFELCDQIFLIIFTVELAMQFIYHGFRLFLDGWLVFDFTIILLSWAFASAQIIRAFRIFRALRLVTRIEVMRNLVVALFSVMPRMAAIGLLLFLIFYIFAVMFTQLFKDLWEEGLTDFNYFSRLDSTFFTLFQIMTLDEWSAVARDVMHTYPWAWAPFVVFVIISGFVVVNLIIAVICDAIAALHDDEKAKLHGTYDSEFEAMSSADAGDSASGGGSPTGRHHSADREEMESDDAQRQIEILEKQIEELVRIQQQSMRTIEALSRHVQITKIRDSMENSMSVVDLVPK